METIKINNKLSLEIDPEFTPNSVEAKVIKDKDCDAIITISYSEEDILLDTVMGTITLNDSIKVLTTIRKYIKGKLLEAS